MGTIVPEIVSPNSRIPTECISGGTVTGSRAGIKEENPVFHMIDCLVRMAVNNHVNIMKEWPYPLFQSLGGTPPMNKSDPVFSDVQHQSVRQNGPHLKGIHIAVNPVETAFFQKFHHIHGDDIPRVQDHVHMAQILIVNPLKIVMSCL